jgi:hypothetical protein
VYAVRETRQDKGGYDAKWVLCMHHFLTVLLGRWRLLLLLLNLYNLIFWRALERTGLINDHVNLPAESARDET